ncbi:hypothetical protein ABUR84_14350, partial [Staphylococcus aureus]|uniref:hypothetical protein n=1 Tax=Staphylococcus aureus TaxID=1280 RepID=UPI00338F2F67
FLFARPAGRPAIGPGPRSAKLSAWIFESASVVLSFSPRIAVFDLDVTLTQYDTFLPFIVGYLRHYRKRRSLWLWKL